MGDLDHIRRFLAHEGILMCFSGPFRHGIIEELGRALRRHLETQDLRTAASADVFTVFIEAAQNVSNYARSDHWRDDERALVQNGVLVIGRQGERFVVRCGNYVHPRDSGPLLARLDQLAALDADGLKALFKARLRAEAEAGGGAGLGLIRMARTASRPLSYGAVAGEAGLDFFSLTVEL